MLPGVVKNTEPNTKGRSPILAQLDRALDSSTDNDIYVIPRPIRLLLPTGSKGLTVSDKRVGLRSR